MFFFYNLLGIKETRNLHEMLNELFNHWWKYANLQTLKYSNDSNFWHCNCLVFKQTKMTVVWLTYIIASFPLEWDVQFVLQVVSAVGEVFYVVLQYYMTKATKINQGKNTNMNRESLSLLFTSAYTFVDRCGSNWYKFDHPFFHLHMLI